VIVNGQCRVNLMTNIVLLTDQREFDFVPGNSVYQVFGHDAVLMDEGGTHQVRGNVSIPRSLKHGRLLRIRPAIWNPNNRHELFRILSCGTIDDYAPPPPLNASPPPMVCTVRWI
jgi:hypothetical protein